MDLGIILTPLMTGSDYVPGKLCRVKSKGEEKSSSINIALHIRVEDKRVQIVLMQDTTSFTGSCNGLQLHSCSVLP